MSVVEAIAQQIGSENVILDEEERLFFAHDVFRAGKTPVAVVRPGSVSELAEVVRLAYESGTPIVTRGGGASYTDAYAHMEDGGITIDSSRLNRIEISEANATVTVEAGVTWARLREAVLAKGFKTPFWGSYSGLFATVGGGTSNNAISHGKGAASDCVLCLEVITGKGELLRTGSALSEGTAPFSRHYGPDLTGVFTGDCGALGIKARITLPLVKAPPAFAAASFAFTEFENLHACFREIALEDLVEENFGLNATLQQGQLGKADTSAKVEMAGKIVKQSGLVKGAAKLARMAASGEQAIATAPFAGHFIVEGADQAEADAKIRRVKRIGARFGTEIPNSVPEVVRAMPFAPFHNILGPKGERWLPCHALLAHSEVVPFNCALQALFEEERAVLERHQVDLGAMFMAVGSTEFVYEPTFYWPDARNRFHERIVEADHLSSLPTYPRSEEAEREVLRIKKRVVELMHKHGAVHLQVGKVYPLAQDHNPAHWALLRALKAELDPKGILNPGSLGI
ncbi:FAD-binding oxidoreductase [Altererythrobacter sp. GH1-8]|uniref:FAD-binding oxidoreductase n=1 Tax=Altererythrobacter sp. GH1-8 TaxID=3349333 RepID=UPI00374D29CC